MMRKIGSHCAYAYRNGDKAYALSQVEKGVWLLGELCGKPFARFNSKHAALRHYKKMVKGI